MKKCKIFLHLLSFFAFALPYAAEAQSFQEIDLERLIKKHPMLQRFQPETGRFTGTPSEIRKVEELEQQAAQISESMKKLESDKQQKLHELMTAPMHSTEDEEAAWSFINSCDLEIASKTTELEAIRNLLVSDGIPGYETVMKIAGQIRSETIASCTATASIILNKLPRFQVPEPPEVGDNSLRRFFFSADSEALRRYCQKASHIGLLFEKTDSAIIFQESSEGTDTK